MGFNVLIGQQCWIHGQSQAGSEDLGMAVVVGLGINHFELVLCGGGMNFYLIPTIWIQRLVEVYNDCIRINPFNHLYFERHVIDGRWVSGRWVGDGFGVFCTWGATLMGIGLP